MPLSELERNIEALLFVADEPMTIHALARLLDTDETVVQEALGNLDAALFEHGLRLQRSNNGFQLTTAPECSQVVERFLGVGSSARLSQAALETLSVVAYRQPVTRAQIESIRGVNSEGALHSLISRGLVAAVGRLEQVGRPVLYATTPDFLQYLGLNSLAELPPLPDTVVAAGSDELNPMQ